ncbi:MAG: pyrimidine 5'-nucleotidase [Rubricella sp.]
MGPIFADIRVWIFDLDNTLYPPEARLFDQIETLMHAYVMRELDVSEAEADHLRRRYWLDHGTTLAGLMANHEAIDPHHFLREVHDIDLDHLTHDEALGAAIAALPGRRIVFTNGSRLHGERVTAARGLSGVFDAIYGIEDTGLIPKPRRAAFDAIFSREGIAGPEAAMFEDDARNLEVPHGMGLRTVLVSSEASERPAHVDFVTRDLGGFLSRLP